MKSFRFCFALFAAAALASTPALARQAAPAASPQTPTIKTTVDEVLLDIVVRDKKGKPVNDLKPEDLSITDNGTRQSVTSFRLVQGAEAISPTGAKITLDPLRQVRLVTLAFESMDAPDQRKTARTAAIDLVKGDQGTNVFYSVVMINTRLMVLQQFTTDKALLTAAIERATTGLSVDKLLSESDRIKSDLRRYLAGPTNQQGVLAAAVDATNTAQAVNNAAGPPANVGSLGSQQVQAMLVSTMLNMLRQDSSMTDGSRMSLEALKSLVLGLAPMPGRKSVLYFTSGFYLPTNLDVMFRNLMSNANRANVTFYSVDTGGVKTWSQNQSAADQLAGATAATKADVTAGGATSEGRTTTEQIRASDTAETAGRNNVQLPIRDLAEATGGFLIGDSNDLKVPLRRVNEEISSYYEVSYNPGITNYDGSFRKLKVDVARKDLKVNTRNGYFALAPEVRAAGIETFELPLLKAISDGASAKDIEYRAAGLLLQPHPQGTDTQVLVEIPLRNFTPKVDPAKNTQNIHFSIAALIKDSTGEVVQKLTRDRSLQVTAEQLKAGSFTEKFSVTIAPGKYSFETAVMDRESGKIGAQRSALVVSPNKGVAVSSITPVKSYNPAAKPQDPSEPFQFQNGTIAPTLLSSLTVANPEATLPLFFIVYKDAANLEKPTMEIEFLQGGRSLGKLPLPLADPDAQGRIQTVFSVPAGRFPEGVYQIHAIATQGDTTADSTTEITIKKQ
ncbi:MAG: VWA domain-containing protein [Bryobacteraceae bacterium]